MGEFYFKIPNIYKEILKENTWNPEMVSEQSQRNLKASFVEPYFLAWKIWVQRSTDHICRGNQQMNNPQNTSFIGLQRPSLQNFDQYWTLMLKLQFFQASHVSTVTCLCSLQYVANLWVESYFEVLL